VVGLEERVAVRRMQEAKLNVTVEEIPSLEPAGIVVRQSRSPGSTVPQGTSVTISVSNGETPIAPLPDFSGLTFDEAVEAADEFQVETNVVLTLVGQDQPTTDPNLIGKIIQTNPPAGTEISASASISVLIGVEAPPPPPDEGEGGG
jgi:serine/threonine-protein kinase